MTELLQAELSRHRCHLPVLPHPQRLETIDTLKAAIPARAALAGFDQALKQSSISDAAISAFCLMESAGALQLSGQAIELRAALLASENGQVTELSHYHLSRLSAHQRLIEEPVSASLALELGSTMTAKSVSVRKNEGSEDLSLSLCASFAKWLPPMGSERIQILLNNWQGFIQQNSGDLDPLIMIAAAQGQWNALQPFSANNIAIGQLLSSLLMCEEDLIPAPALPISLYLSRRAERHWDALYNAVAHGRHADWIQFYMTAVTEASLDATQQLMKWEKLKQSLAESMRHHLPKAPSAELIDVCSYPSFGLAELSHAGLTRRQTASAWMQRMISEGLLGEIKIGKEKRYVNHSVLDLLT